MTSPVAAAALSGLARDLRAAVVERAQRLRIDVDGVTTEELVDELVRRRQLSLRTAAGVRELLALGRRADAGAAVDPSVASVVAEFAADVVAAVRTARRAPSAEPAEAGLDERLADAIARTPPAVARPAALRRIGGDDVFVVTAAAALAVLVAATVAVGVAIAAESWVGAVVVIVGLVALVAAAASRFLTAVDVFAGWVGLRRRGPRA